MLLAFYDYLHINQYIIQRYFKYFKLIVFIETLDVYSPILYRQPS